MAPTLVALAFAGAANVARAQGTMDLSGAQTLMGTFNVRPPSVQSKVVFANRFEVVPEELMRSADCQREGCRNFEQGCSAWDDSLSVEGPRSDIWKQFRGGQPTTVGARRSALRGGANLEGV
jgi:hypothetical protein